MRKMNMIRSENHDIYSKEVNKVALSNEDDKRDREFSRQVFFSGILHKTVTSLVATRGHLRNVNLTKISL